MGILSPHVVGMKVADGQVYTIKATRTGKRASARMWTKVNGQGGGSDCHGRWEDGAAPGQWKQGDAFEVEF